MEQFESEDVPAFAGWRAYEKRAAINTADDASKNSVDSRISTNLINHESFCKCGFYS